MKKKQFIDEYNSIHLRLDKIRFLKRVVEEMGLKRAHDISNASTGNTAYSLLTKEEHKLRKSYINENNS